MSECACALFCVLALASASLSFFCWPASLVAQAAGLLVECSVSDGRFEVRSGEGGDALVDAAHAAGLPLFVYTVDEPADVKRMAAIGVDGIITNYPDRTARLLDEMP